MKTLACFVCVCGSLFAAGRTPEFAAPRIVIGDPPPDLTNPLAAIAADFNGDGIPDLAAANQDAGDASIFLGKGDGTFQSPIHVAIGGWPRYLVAADFDGDGRLDLVSDNGRFLPGRGDGTFAPARVITDVPCCSLYVSTYVAAGDFNGDGRMDVAFYPQSKLVKVFFGRGDGTFTSGPEMIAGGGLPTPLVVADLDRDGHLDLVTGPASALDVYLNQGDGTFRRRSVSLGSAASGTVVAAGDFNGDGIPDLVTAFARLSILLGNGDGSFRVAPDLPTPKYYFGGVAVGDLDGDGIPDLAATNGYSIFILRALGDGTMALTDTYYFHVNENAVSTAAFLAAADFDRDGRLDLAIGDPLSATISIQLNDSGGRFRSSTILGKNREFTRLIAADFNGDGRPDLAVIDAATQTVWVSLNLGKGEFGPASTFPIGIDEDEYLFCDLCPLQPVAADFNRDGNLDLAIQSPFGVYIFLGDGNGHFRSAGAFLRYATNVAAADFDGDGTPDLLVSGQDTVMLLGRGDGTFAAPVTVSPLCCWVAAGDVNGDGHPDFLVPWDGPVSYLGDGHGTFYYVVNRNLPILGGLLVDINGDGKPDLIAPTTELFNFDFVPGSIYAVLGNGDGSFSNPQQYQGHYSNLAIADLDGDGKPDLATFESQGSNTILRILIGRGDGTFEPGPDITPGLVMRNLVAADFDGDGQPDLAVALRGQVLLLRNTTKDLDPNR